MMRTSFIICLSIAVTVLGMRKRTVPDSLIITGHYMQDGETLNRRRMEKMLLTVDDANPYIKKAKKHRVASSLIGLSMWGISMGITISQFTSVLKDLDEGKQPVAAELDKFMLPLAIGGEISSFFQIRFTARSSYYTRKGVVAFNDHLCRERGLNIEYDHHIKKSESKKTWFIQDSVYMSTETMYLVLREHTSSWDDATMSLIFRELATRTAGVGLTYLLVAILGAQYDDLNKGYLTVGISTTTFSIITAIATMVTRKRALRDYNKATTAKRKCGQ